MFKSVYSSNFLFILRSTISSKPNQINKLGICNITFHCKHNSLAQVGSYQWVNFVVI